MNIKRLLAHFVRREQYLSDGQYFYTLSFKYKLSNRDIAKREKTSRSGVAGKIYRHRQLYDIPAQPSPMRSSQ